MKRFLFFLMLFASSWSCFAQTDAETFAKRAFKEGEYADAVRWYQAAIAQTDDISAKATLAQALAQAKNCDAIQQRAKSYYSQSKYELAKQSFQKLLAANPSDTKAKKMIDQCDSQIANAAKTAADNRLWATVIGSNDISAYRDYLNKFPKGIHSESAKQYIAEDDLWNDTKSVDSEHAYKQYIETSKLHLHKKDAEIKLAYIADSKKWQAVLAKNNEQAYKEYVAMAGKYSRHKPEAEAKIALFDAQRNYDYGQYSDARKCFEKAKKYHTLDSHQEQMYRYVCEITDFQSISVDPTVEKCNAFLSNYPYSIHTADVKNQLAKAYCDNHDFSSAYSVVQDNATKQYIRIKEKEYKKRSKAYNKSASRYGGSSSSKNGSKNGRSWNIGADFDMWANSLSLTLPRVEFQVGDFDNTVNFAVGLQYRHRTGWSDSKYKINSSDWIQGSYDDVFKYGQLPHLTADQLGVPLTLRYNIGSSKTKCMLAAGVSANWTFNAKYKRKTGYYTEETETFKNPDFSLANKFNISPFLRFGVGECDYEISVYVRYDATPVYNINAVDAVILYNQTPINLYQMLKPIRQQTDGRIAVGLSLTYMIPY